MDMAPSERYKISKVEEEEVEAEDTEENPNDPKPNVKVLYINSTNSTPP